MTVKELKQKLVEMDDNETVCVMLEHEDSMQFFDVVDVSAHRGTPMRTPAGAVGYRLESSGPENWTIITIERA